MKEGEIGDDWSFWAEDEPTLEKGEQVRSYFSQTASGEKCLLHRRRVSGKYAICSDDAVKIGSSCGRGNDGSRDRRGRETRFRKPNKLLDELLSEIENAE